MKKINKSSILYILLFSILITIIIVVFILNGRNGLFGSIINNNTFENKLVNTNFEEGIVLYKYDGQDISSKIYIKNMNNESFDRLNKIIDSNKKSYSIIDFVNLPDYTIENYDNQINIRFTNLGVIITKSDTEAIEIFDKDQVTEISDILDYKYDSSILNYSILELENLKSPPALYINNNIETRIFGYRWYSNFSGICGNTSFDEIIDNNNTIKKQSSLILSTNKDASLSLMTKLPETIKINYNIYKYDSTTQIFSAKPILEKEAIRTINGDFYLEMPNELKGDFVYHIRLSNKDSDDIGVSYYFRYICN